MVPQQGIEACCMNTYRYDAVSYFQFTINLCCTAIYNARNVNCLQGNTENIYIQRDYPCLFHTTTQNYNKNNNQQIERTTFFGILKKYKKNPLGLVYIILQGEFKQNHCYKSHLYEIQIWIPAKHHAMLNLKSAWWFLHALYNGRWEGWSDIHSAFWLVRNYSVNGLDMSKCTLFEDGGPICGISQHSGEFPFI